MDMSSRLRGSTAVVVSLLITVGGVAGAVPASAAEMPQGRTKWQRVGGSSGKPIVVVRQGEQIKMRSWEGPNRKIGYWLEYKGTVKGNTIRWQVNEGYGGWTKERYRLNGKTLRIKWQGDSEWTVFKRV